MCVRHLSEALECLRTPFAQLGDENHGTVQHACRGFTTFHIHLFVFFFFLSHKNNWHRHESEHRRALKKGTLLTVVLLGEERSSCGSKQLAEIVDFSHNVNSTQGRLGGGRGTCVQELI